MSFKELLFGRRLRTEEEQVEKLGILSGIPAVGLDALASAAYGPEAALTVLIALGTMASAFIVPITGFIIALLIAVALSYRQTIPAYPSGGGSFTVAKENLGQRAGLVAASALCIDYVLNVAVAISAGVGAMVSAVPSLLPYTLPLCLVILAFITIVNVRGVRSAGILFMLPTYLFVGCLGLAIIIGIVKTVLAHGHPVPVILPPKMPVYTTTVSFWLLMRAFASGCTALTGVEAVSNAVPIFREPSTRLAGRTLIIIIAVLGLLVAGVAFLSHSYGITATPPGQAGYQSILSQMIAAVAGRGAFYYVSIAAVLMVLTLSANTSFTDFPRVCRLLALDEYLPAEFALRGGRLVYTEGIYALAVLSGLILIIYGGITDRLIPLFAIGAFTAFTFSQAGMVVHWHRSKQPGATRFLVFNGLGAAATAAALIIIVISKFMEGAWLIIILMPSVVLVLRYIRRYHERIERAVQENVPLDTKNLSQPIIVIPLKRLDLVAQKALTFALMLSPEIHVVQILGEDMNMEDLSKQWPKLVERPARKAGYTPPQLTVIRSPYREFFGPLLNYIRKVASENKDRYIAIIVPELVERRWYNFLLRRRATLVKELLVLHGGPQIVIIDAPWYLRKGRSFR